MNEDEIIQIVKDYINYIRFDEKPKYSASQWQMAIEDLLDLYQQEKEKNKELERYKKYYESEKIVWYKGDYVSKDKIRNKIYQLNISDILEDQIAIPYLKELLKEEK